MIREKMNHEIMIHETVAAVFVCALRDPIVSSKPRPLESRRPVKKGSDSGGMLLLASG